MSRIICKCGYIFPLTRSVKCPNCDVCITANCSQPKTDLDYCARHYMHYWRYGAVEKSCKGCGAPIELYQKYCDRCRLVARRKASRKSQARRRVVLEASEPVDHLEVYLLDNKTCYLCNDEILCDYWIDHIIPVSRGGHHNINNLAATHRGCNQKKSNKMPGEIINIFPEMKLPERFGGEVDGAESTLS